jgi:hypothetical protein
MTVLLKKAFDKASVLSEELQDELAEELIADIEAESCWEQTFKNTQDELSKMADKAMKNFEEGKFRQLGFDQL